MILATAEPLHKKIRKGEFSKQEHEHEHEHKAGHMKRGDFSFFHRLWFFHKNNTLANGGPVSPRVIYQLPEPMSATFSVISLLRMWVCGVWKLKGRCISDDGVFVLCLVQEKCREREKREREREG